MHLTFNLIIPHRYSMFTEKSWWVMRKYTENPSQILQVDTGWWSSGSNANFDSFGKIIKLKVSRNSQHWSLLQDHCFTNNVKPPKVRFLSSFNLMTCFCSQYNFSTEDASNMSYPGHGSDMHNTNTRNKKIVFTAKNAQCGKFDYQ